MYCSIFLLATSSLCAQVPDPQLTRQFRLLCYFASHKHQRNEFLLTVIAVAQHRQKACIIQKNDRSIIKVFKKDMNKKLINDISTMSDAFPKRSAHGETVHVQKSLQNKSENTIRKSRGRKAVKKYGEETPVIDEPRPFGLGKGQEKFKKNVIRRL